MGRSELSDACPNTVPGARVDAVGCPAKIRGDYDRDGDVDGADMQVFLACLSGPAVAAETGCADKDFEPDGDVDVADFGVFQRAVSGAGVPVKVTG